MRALHWRGFENEDGCSLCGTWRPGERSDERLLAMDDYAEMIWTASLYRKREQGRVLVRAWAERHGDDVEELLRLARL